MDYLFRLLSAKALNASNVFPLNCHMKLKDIFFQFLKEERVPALQFF